LLNCSFVSINVSIVSLSGLGFSAIIYACMLLLALWHRSANSRRSSFARTSDGGVDCTTCERRPADVRASSMREESS
jgi:hypothetical protein